MSTDSKNNEWDSLWGEYSKSLENWKSLFEQIQNASNDMQTKFNQVWEKASAESSPETIKDFTLTSISIVELSKILLKIGKNL